MSILSFRRKDTALSSASTLLGTSITNDGVNKPAGPLGLNLLHSPSKPLVDFVFVHGLGGGSRKTWSKTKLITDYWPQEWLPKDPAFKDVRVHSFGYDSDWTKRTGSFMDVHHFSKALLGEMFTSPCLESSRTPLVLIGHSMGGLVIKKAYMLSKQAKCYDLLSQRIRTLYFLATPHKGSDSARLLKNILQMTNMSVPYVADLEKGSVAIQHINDEFCEFATDLDICSFYETKKLKYGPLSTLIVDPDSAILGYPEEKQVPMNADHRSICKFDTPMDPSYVTLRNALALTVQQLASLVTKTEESQRHSQLAHLSTYLKMPFRAEDDFVNVEDARMQGTCEWITSKDSYREWCDTASNTPRVLWVTGRPAAGKSVLAGYVISQLEQQSFACSHFFFRYGDKTKSRLDICLRSLAFQMASHNSGVREKFSGMQKMDERLELASPRNMWRRLFMSGIFKTMLTPQFWVIDGLDECEDGALFLDSMLASLDDATPLRVFITSRESPELQKRVDSFGVHRARHERMTIADTLPDIELLVKTNIRSVSLDSDEQRQDLVGKLLAKSEGSFLWTALVLESLSKSYGEQEISQSLEDLPPDIENLYQRTLYTLSKAGSGKRFAQAALMWTACAFRPLTTRELQTALQLDIKDNFSRIEESIMAVCGHLVVVDKTKRVHMVHGSAREFLLKGKVGSEFAISKVKAHTRIARACLAYLVGPEMKPPRTSRRGLSSARPSTKRDDFSAYACSAFSYHLSKADPLSSDILLSFEKFLKSNVLSWIEAIAQEKDLKPLIRTANNIKKYFSHCAVVRSPLGHSMHLIKGWTIDLVRVVTKFADALILSPSAIYSLILPFCPSDSVICKTPGIVHRLAVIGISNAQWDDRLSCIDFREHLTTALSSGDDYFAVGLISGSIVIYHLSSCQYYKGLMHGEVVKHLKFKNRTAIMASCGRKLIRVWDVSSGDLLHNFQAPLQVLDLSFNHNSLIAASSKNHVAMWNLNDNGPELREKPWDNAMKDSSARSFRAPCAISMSVGHSMLAVAYNGQAIMLWDTEGEAYFGTCGRKTTGGETTTHMVTALLFNPNPDIELLAASYLDGQLVVLDPFNDQVVEGFRANCHILAASPDGVLLAGASGSGTIQVYEFETLRMLYRVRSANLHIKQIAFSRDSLRFCDIRGSHCNIWEPPALLRDSPGDDSSEDTSNSVTDVVATDTGIRVSVMVLAHEADCILCGKDDGSVSLYDLKTGKQKRVLYSHKTQLRLLAWWPERRAVCSVDASNSIFMWQLERLQQTDSAVEKAIFQARVDDGDAIVQILIGDAAGKFVLATRNTDYLWNVEGKQEMVRSYADDRGLRRWVQHQESPFHIICIEASCARVYAWSDWSEFTSVSLLYDVRGLQLKNVYTCTVDHQARLLLELSKIEGSLATHALQLFNAESFVIQDPDRNAAVPGTDDEDLLVPLPSLNFAALAVQMVQIVGVLNDSQLVFFDIHSWICSTQLNSLDGGLSSYSRHFFVPHDWYAGAREISCIVTGKDVVFARNDEIVIVKSGLEFNEEVKIQAV
ncbi:uncharacterized protein KY384_002428 [Bacidia gigantensis]|uniref:uncharacterized protein n=1 Tax=Bacidia gigantensis TaxID=2732470 RepID=UPI001D04B97E|nr:uncharacterized protein KY384_002428 [Bacidia gigantensis]KAG8532551.1 hypothetical protein KY384_002428 [Bacidia gigantensis]